ncbi:MAG: hypothetical protein RR547_13225, partial [Raoultibacter sp.]
TKQDGTGVPYGDGDWVKNLAASGVISTTLYALWDEAYKVDVPLDPTITIDAQGSVASDVTTKFINRGADSVNVTALEVTVLPGALEIFSSPADVELVMTDATDKKSKASVYLATGNKGYCNIVLPGSSERPMAFTFNVPSDTTLHYKDTPVSVASVSYTFALAQGGK